ncbi:hypothetical protein SLS64_009773 [Diaporthe eres]
MADSGTEGQATNGNAGTQQPSPSGGRGVGPNGGPPVSRFRQSQYAEAIANPLPELAVVSELEPVSNIAQLEVDDTASSTRAVVQPDNIDDPRGSAVVYAGEKPTLWRNECADPSDFLSSVSFMGVKGAPGNGGWKTTYYGAAKDSKDCCAHCYKAVSDGCNSWAYMPSAGFSGTSCAMITGWDTGDDKDSTCPSGHGATIYFTTDSDNSTDVGAAGPCGVTDD